MRSRINLYKDPNVTRNEMQLDDKEKPSKKKNADSVRLEELFDNLDF